jgi:hypothetical protein
MLEVFVPRPNLSLMDRLDAFGEGFQGMASVENATRSAAKGIHHTLWLGTLQKHDGGRVARFSCFLKDSYACCGAVLKFFTDQYHIWFVRPHFADNFLRASGQGFDREALSAVAEGILQQLTRHVIRGDDEHRYAIFGARHGHGHAPTSNALRNMFGGRRTNSEPPSVAKISEALLRT